MITVNGRSSFKAGASFAYGVTANGASSFDGSFKVSCNGYDFININGVSESIGSESRGIAVGYFTEIHAGSIDSSNRRTDIRNNVGIIGDLEVSKIYASEDITSDGNITLTNGDITANGELSVSGNTTLSKITITDNSPLVLGTYNSKNVYLKQYNGGVDVFGNLAPGAKTAYSLGTESYKWNDIFVNSFNGSIGAIRNIIETSLTPSYASSTSFQAPIGCIVMFRIQRYISANTAYEGFIYYPGQIVASNLFNMVFGSVCFKNGLFERGHSANITTGSYKLLSVCGFSPVSSQSSSFYQYCYSIAIRVA